MEIGAKGRQGEGRLKYQLRNLRPRNAVESAAAQSKRLNGAEAAAVASWRRRSPSIGPCAGSVAE